MNLAALLTGVQVTKLFQMFYGRMVVTQDVDVNAIQYDSRKIQPRDCFVAIKGTGTDGHAFVTTAIERGASVVVLENDAVLPDSYFLHAGVVKIVVPDSRRALAIMSSNYYGEPSRALKLVGVTGTNGKTTTTHLVKSIMESSGMKTGLIGTIEYKIGDEVIPATHTTPESLELNQLFAAMVKNGCTAAAMEVSSHALHQSRTYGLDFDAAVFTNLTQDHLDYHGTMDAYFLAKKILFDNLKPRGIAIANADDPFGDRIVASTRGITMTYSAEQPATVVAKNVRLSIEGTTFDLLHNRETTTISSPLVGRFNVYNMLAAGSAGIAIGIPKETIRKGIEKVDGVRGRFEKIRSPRGWTVIIDYAHTPDALEKCLTTIHEVLPQTGRGRITTVFGAGGDRDKTKRPLMAAAAGRLSDFVIVTSDNPRTEDPEKILDDILQGLPHDKPHTRQADRRRAIEDALDQARLGDVVLIAGKGHEDYQVIGSNKIHFSDREIVEEFIAHSLK